MTSVTGVTSVAEVTGVTSVAEVTGVAGVAAELRELAAEFPGYEFSMQQTWEGVSLSAVRQDGSARPGLYAVITADLEEMRRALREGERPPVLTSLRLAGPAAP